MSEIEFLLCRMIRKIIALLARVFNKNISRRIYMNSKLREQLSGQLQEILNSKEPCCIAINGKWGVGKTHFWKEFASSNYRDKVAYVSLFGKSSLKDK